jgi:hypothetical protein
MTTELRDRSTKVAFALTLPAQCISAIQMKIAVHENSSL